jgi:hypothetical protein
VVRAVPAATGRQVGVVAGFKRGRERAEAEEQHKQDGKDAPHLTEILHDECVDAHFLGPLRGILSGHIGSMRSGIIDSCSGSSTFPCMKEAAGV